MGQDHWCESHGPLPQVQGLLLEWVLCCVVLHQWTGAYQGRPLGQQPCHPCKTIIVSFRFSTTNCFRYWYWVATHHASRWCNLAIRGLQPEFDTEVGGKTFELSSHEHSSGETVISGTPHRVSSQASTAILTFTVLIIQRHEKKNTRRSRWICGLLTGHGRALFKKNYFGAAVKNRGGNFIYFNFKIGKTRDGESIDLTIIWCRLVRHNHSNTASETVNRYSAFEEKVLQIVRFGEYSLGSAANCVAVILSLFTRSPPPPAKFWDPALDSNDDVRYRL